jgi:hypothetical protein
MKQGQPAGGQRRTGPPGDPKAGVPRAESPAWGQEGDYNPSNQEIWDTIRNNQDPDEESAKRIRLAADYWNDQKPDPWGLNQPGAKVAPSPDPSEKSKGGQKKEVRRRDEEYDEDDDDDDDDYEYEDDDDEPEVKPSIFAGVMSSVKSVFTRKGKDSDDDDEEDDDEDDDEDRYESDDEDEGEWQSDDDDEEDDDEDDDDDDDDDEDANPNTKRNIIIGISAVALVLVLSAGMFFLLRGPMQRLFTGGSPSPSPAPEQSTEEPATNPPEENIDPNAGAETPPLPDNDPSFRTAGRSGRSMSSDGVVVYSSTDEAGVFVMTDEYKDIRRVSDQQVLEVCYANPWIYFSTYEGIFRLSYDSGGSTAEQVVYEEYTEPLSFFVLDGYLYYPEVVEPGLCNICRISEDLSENKVLMERVSVNFLVDMNGVYSFGPEAGAADIPQMDGFTSSDAMDDPEHPPQFLYFSDIVAQYNWRIARMAITELTGTKSGGVVAKVSEMGMDHYYFVSKDGAAKSSVPRDYFLAPSGIYYELQDTGETCALVKKTSGNADQGETVAYDIQTFAYKFYDNSLYYFQSALVADRLMYNLRKYNFLDDSDIELVNFSNYNIDIGYIAQQHRISFDKITPEVIALEGYLINTAGGLTYFDRISGNWAELQA